jgi:hypothetical protein
VFSGYGRERVGVARRFYYDLVRAYAVHHVVEAVAGTVKVTFDLQDGEFIGYYANLPVRGGVAIVVSVVVDHYLGRGLILIAGAEGAKAALYRLRALSKLRGAFTALGRYDDPTPNDGIFSKLGHGFLSLFFTSL